MDQNLRTRREILAAGMAGGISLLLASCGGATAQKAAAVKPAGSDLGAVEHVVFLMHENRSFDHYFGTYKGVRGFDDARGPGAGDLRPGLAGRDGPHSSPLPSRHGPQPSRVHLRPVAPVGRPAPVLEQREDGQLRRHPCQPHWEGPEQGTLTMGYYTRQDLPFYYSLADAFTICDGYHCSVMGPTHPNRLHALSGTLDPAGIAGGPMVWTDPNPSAMGSARWSTMPEALEDAGVSWKVYNAPGADYQPTSKIAMGISDNILLYFKQFVSDPSSALYQKAFGPVFPDDFVADIKHDTLPSVSWITPPNGYDEHPPSAAALGMWFSHNVISALVSNPKIWSKTVLFIMYDENDGFFDHVVPPTPPPGTAGEYLTSDPLPALAFGIDGPVGLGFRVPMLVVSPFSRGGYVCSDTFDHTSQMRFLETRFGVKAPNISAWRRSVTGDLTDRSPCHVARHVGAEAPGHERDERSGRARRVHGGPAAGGRRERPRPLSPARRPADPHQEPGKARRVTTA